MKYFKILFVVLMLMVNPISVFADDNASDSSTSEVSPSDSGEKSESNSSGGGDGGLFERLAAFFKKLNEMFQKVNEIWNNLQLLMTPEGIVDLFNGMVVKIVDDALAPMLGIFGSSLLFLPEIKEADFVHDNWSRMAILSIPFILFSLGLSGLQLVRGKREMLSMFRAALVGLVVIFLSLSIINGLLIFSNYLLEQALINMLDTTIDLKSLSGQDVIKAMVGGLDAIEDPELSLMTLGQFLVQTENGGLLGLLGVTVFVVLPLFLVVFIKTMVMFGLAIFCPGWGAYAVFRSKEEVIVGWGNLFFRTLMIGIMISLAWGQMVEFKTDTLNGEGIAAFTGVSPIIFNCILVIIILLLTWIFWARPLLGAAKAPFELNGGQAIMKLGETQQKASDIVMDIAKRYQVDGWQEKSLSWKSKGKELEEKGRLYQEQQVDFGKVLQSKILSRSTMRNSELLEGIQYKQTQEYFKHLGSVSKIQDQAVLSFDQPIDLQSLKKIFQKEHAGEEWINHLEFDSRMNQVVLKQEHEPLFQQALENMLNSEDNYWETSNRKYVVLENGVPKEVDVKPTGFNLGSYKGFADAVEPVGDGKDIIRLPDGSAFSDEFIAFVRKRNPLEAWANRVQLNEDKNQLVVEKSYSSKWQNELDEFYRKHTPYWQNKNNDYVSMDNGEVQVFQDKPGNGIFMGNYENHNKIHSLGIKERAAQDKKMNDIFILPDDDAIQTKITKFIDSQNKSHLHSFLQFDENKLKVEQAYAKEMETVLHSFFNSATPYWIDRKGKVMVLDEGIPVNVGYAPTNGVYMGRFEQLQSNAIQSHHSKKKNGGDSSEK
ncbi:MAG TPA: hypothetical protein GXX18_06150 [Bacillales bacterium]|nr:hypothetical protein [Bacillales bacterium]